jgi:SAM-dependent methyltransferase
MDTTDITENMDVALTHKHNAAWWDETAAWYGRQGNVDEEIAFLRSGGNYLLDSERQLMGDLAPWCRCAIHLQCSHGRDALSLLNLGADRVVGVDISERLLAVARHKADALGAHASWVLSDILETSHELDGTADLVYMGKGALCWMMDIAAWATVVARLLVPGGRFFVHEAHPLDWVWDTKANDYVLDSEYGDYFSAKLRERLFAHDTQSTPRYRQWTLGQIVNSLIAAGPRIECLMEYPAPFWDQFQSIPAETLRRLPHAFALLACKD